MATKEKDTWVEPAENPESHGKIIKMLKDKKIKYKLSEHKAVRTSEEAAEARGVTLASGAKAILLKDTGKKLALEGVPYYLAISSASNKFDSKTFKKLINCKSLRFALP